MSPSKCAWFPYFINVIRDPGLIWELFWWMGNLNTSLHATGRNIHLYVCHRHLTIDDIMNHNSIFTPKNCLSREVSFPHSLEINKSTQFLICQNLHFIKKVLLSPSNALRLLLCETITDLMVYLKQFINYSWHCWLLILQRWKNKYWLWRLFRKYTTGPLDPWSSINNN